MSRPVHDAIHDACESFVRGSAIFGCTVVDTRDTAELCRTQQRAESCLVVADELKQCRVAVATGLPTGVAIEDVAYHGAPIHCEVDNQTSIICEGTNAQPREAHRSARERSDVDEQGIRRGDRTEDEIQATEAIVARSRRLPTPIAASIAQRRFRVHVTGSSIAASGCSQIGHASPEMNVTCT